MSKVIALDIDGVLADYNNRVREDLLALGDEMRVWEDGKDPSLWDWYHPYGASVPGVLALHKRTQDPKWWRDLGRHRDMEEFASRELLREVCRRNEVYFVTYRPRGMRDITRQWLEENLSIREPHVIVCGEAKELIVQSLQADCVIEDNATTLLGVNKSRKLLIQRAYNKFAWAEPDLELISSTTKALELLND